jgi:geranylgeranyl pyrophosphate synthase
VTIASSQPAPSGSNAASAWELPELLGLSSDIQALHELLATWLDGCDAEVRVMVARQLGARAKYFRPVTIFACYRAVSAQRMSRRVLTAAAAVEISHNVSLIIDDILDRSRFRRGSLSLHCRFGFLPALMTAGYMGFAGTRLVAGDGYSVGLISELMQRLGAAECFQWRLRRQPLGVEDWRAIAGADTGTMFEICARLGTRDDRLRKYGLLLGILYHGCDDVADVRGTTALGGGSEKDIIDGIVTLPAAIAVRDPDVAALFREAGPQTLGDIAARLRDALPAAEEYLDRIAGEAEAEARSNAVHPGKLIELVRHTRALSVA